MELENIPENAEIYDETEEYIIKRNDKEYVIQALTPIDFFNDYFAVNLDNEAFDTVGGFIIGRLERVPEKGEKVEEDNFRFEVLKADGRCVELLKLKIKTKIKKKGAKK